LRSPSRRPARKPREGADRVAHALLACGGTLLGMAARRDRVLRGRGIGARFGADQRVPAAVLRFSGRDLVDRRRGRGPARRRGLGGGGRLGGWVRVFLVVAL